MKAGTAMAVALLVSAVTVTGTAFADHTSESGDTVGFVAAIEFIRGHMDKAVENKKASDDTLERLLAKAHAGRPIGEEYSLIEGKLKEHDPALASKLRNDLISLTRTDSMSVAQLEAKVAEINASLDVVLEVMLSESEREDPAFWAAVARKVLEVAKNEYDEGVQDVQIAKVIDYQDASAFIHRAKVVFESIEAEAPEREAEELNELFDDLEALVARPATAEEVGTVIDGINRELEEAFGSELDGGGEFGGWEYIDRIGELLDQAAAEYEEGNYDEARALAVEAYIDNYEFIESDIEEDDEELKEQIEVDIRVDLIKMIDDRRPAEEVSAHVDQIKSGLATAKAIVTPEFPVALAAVAAVMAAAVAVGRFRGAIFRSP